MNESTIGAVESLAYQSQEIPFRPNVASLGDNALLAPEA